MQVGPLRVPLIWLSHPIVLAEDGKQEALPYFKRACLEVSKNVRYILVEKLYQASFSSGEDLAGTNLS